MKSFTRADRVAGEIQRVVSEILKKDINDPRVKSVSISGVKVTKDIRNARIYFIMTEGKYTKEDAAEGFKSALGYIKRSLATQLGLRYMPGINFYYDESFDYGSHIDNIIKSIKKEDGLSHTPLE